MIPKKLTEEISRWITERKYGSLQINFQDGKIVNVNTVQSMKVEALGFIIGTATVLASQEVHLEH